MWARVRLSFKNNKKQDKQKWASLCCASAGHSEIVRGIAVLSGAQLLRACITLDPDEVGSNTT